MRLAMGIKRRLPRMRMGRMTMPRTIIMTITFTMSIATTTPITATRMLMTTSKPARSRRRAAVASVEAHPVEGAVAAPPVQPIAASAGLDPGLDRELGADQGAALYRLMTWLSPAFPVGAFSYSSGIEWAVEAGDITNAATLQDWLSSLLEAAGFCDGVFLAHAHRAASRADDAKLREVAELAAAFAPSRERHLETTAQGRAFIEIARSAWNCAGLERLIAICNGIVAYPVAVGIVSAAHGIPLAATMHGFLHAVTSNWISAGARLVPLGQTDSQLVLSALEPMVVATGRRALQAALDDAGGASFRADLASMRHETQYTRLFRS
jgi:urease accessory protein